MPITLTEKQRGALALLNRPQRHTLLVGGGRSGKTFLFCYAILVRGLKATGSRHAIFRHHFNAVWKSIGLDTLPKVARAAGVELKADKRDFFFKLPEHRVGSSFERSEIWLAGLDDKERVDKVLGLEFVTIYENESSQIKYASHVTLMTRLAQVCDGLAQRNYVDLNPGGATHWTNQLFIRGVDPERPRVAIPNPEDYAYAVINPADNAENLSPSYIRSLQFLPERQRKRFWDGVYQDEIDNALWTIEAISRARIDGLDPENVPKFVTGEWKTKALPSMQRVVVSVDPSGASGAEGSRNDDIGLVVVGKGLDGRAYLLADRTLNAGPAVWARAAITAYHEFGADAIVAEQNYGGAMVTHTIASADGGREVKVIVVTASRGKAVRAEPISVLYDETIDKVRHVGSFPELEEELLKFSTAGYMGARSPNRADALIWGLSELMLGNGNMGFLDFMKGESEKAAPPRTPPPDLEPAADVSPPSAWMT